MVPKKVCKICITNFSGFDTNIRGILRKGLYIINAVSLVIRTKYYQIRDAAFVFLFMIYLTTTKTVQVLPMYLQMYLTLIQL